MGPHPARPVPPIYMRMYYFKTTVTMLRTACYSGLFLDMVVNDGLVPAPEQRFSPAGQHA